jgi:hypothetical protein
MFQSAVSNQCDPFLVWVVAPFCSDPEATMEFGSITHAQQIVTTFTQLFLMSYFIVLAQNCGLAAMDIPQKLEEALVSPCMNVSLL